MFEYHQWKLSVKYRYAAWKHKKNIAKAKELINAWIFIEVANLCSDDYSYGEILVFRNIAFNCFDLNFADSPNNDKEAVVIEHFVHDERFKKHLVNYYLYRAYVFSIFKKPSTDDYNDMDKLLEQAQAINPEAEAFNDEEVIGYVDQMKGLANSTNKAFKRFKWRIIGKEVKALFFGPIKITSSSLTNTAVILSTILFLSSITYKHLLYNSLGIDSTIVLTIPDYLSSSVGVFFALLTAVLSAWVILIILFLQIMVTIIKTAEYKTKLSSFLYQLVCGCFLIYVLVLIINFLPKNTVIDKWENLVGSLIGLLITTLIRRSTMGTWLLGFSSIVKDLSAVTIFNFIVLLFWNLDQEIEILLTGEYRSGYIGQFTNEYNHLTGSQIYDVGANFALVVSGSSPEGVSFSVIPLNAIKSITITPNSRPDLPP